MKWRDLLYFSKGERRALSILLFLILVTWILLSVSNPVEPKSEAAAVSSPAWKVVSPEKDAIKNNVQRSAAKPFAKTTQKRTASNVKSATFSAQTAKYPLGTVIELNSADTTALKRVPGIGTAFANRIVKYRNLLGGYNTVGQLAEVYGIDEEKYASLVSWFKADTFLITKIGVNTLPLDSMIRHPYLNYKQAKVIRSLRKQKGRLSGWDQLHLLEEFNEQDIERITPYLSFD